MLTSRPHLRPRGFTLVELLVVIAIVALLVSILLPALQRGKESGRLAQCMANMRQIGVGFLVYANDFKQYAPSSWYLDTVPNPDQHPEDGQWMVKLAPYWNEDPTTMNWNWSINDANYAINRIRILQCPSTYKKVTMWGPSCYGPNMYLIGQSDEWSPYPVKPLRFDHAKAAKHSSRLPVAAESVAFNMILAHWNYMFFWNYAHLKQRNYVFADGHVSAYLNPVEHPGMPRHFITAVEQPGQPDSELWGYNNHQGTDTPGPYDPGYTSTP